MIHGSIAGLQETGFTYEHRTNKAYVGSNMLFFSVDDRLKSGASGSSYSLQRSLYHTGYLYFKF